MKTIKELEAEDNDLSRRMINSKVTDNNHVDLLMEFSRLQGNKKTLRDVKKLINNFKGEEYTDKEIWEEIKKELRKQING